MTEVSLEQFEKIKTDYEKRLYYSNLFTAIQEDLKQKEHNSRDYRVSVQSYSIVMKYAAEDLGYHYNSIAYESIQKPNSELFNPSVVMEGFGSFMMSVFDKIFKFFKAIWDFIADLFRKIGNFLKGLFSKTQKQAEQAVKKSDEVKKEIDKQNKASSNQTDSDIKLLPAPTNLTYNDYLTMTLGVIENKKLLEVVFPLYMFPLLADGSSNLTFSSVISAFSNFADKSLVNYDQLVDVFNNLVSTITNKDRIRAISSECFKKYEMFNDAYFEKYIDKEKGIKGGKVENDIINLLSKVMLEPFIEKMIEFSKENFGTDISIENKEGTQVLVYSLNKLDPKCEVKLLGDIVSKRYLDTFSSSVYAMELKKADIQNTYTPLPVVGLREEIKTDSDYKSKLTEMDQKLGLVSGYFNKINSNVEKLKNIVDKLKDGFYDNILEHTFGISMKRVKSGNYNATELALSDDKPTTINRYVKFYRSVLMWYLFDECLKGKLDPMDANAILENLTLDFYNGLEYPDNVMDEFTNFELKNYILNLYSSEFKERMKLMVNEAYSKFIEGGESTMTRSTVTPYRMEIEELITIETFKAVDNEIIKASQFVLNAFVSGFNGFVEFTNFLFVDFFTSKLAKEISNTVQLLGCIPGLISEIDKSKPYDAVRSELEQKLENFFKN